MVFDGPVVENPGLLIVDVGERGGGGGGGGVLCIHCGGAFRLSPGTLFLKLFFLQLVSANS